MEAAQATAGRAVYDDVQARPDARGVAIEQVGIEDLAYPIEVIGRDGPRQRTVARASMTVELAEDRRGVHMSRFVEVLHARAGEISSESLGVIADEIRARLESTSARLELRFPYFLERRAPVSEMASLMEYECTVVAESEPERSRITVGVSVPVTSLCPCSKEISDYGAHNQRGHVEINTAGSWPSGDAGGIWLEDLIDIAETAASSPVYPLLKRTDEREVTMRAYDNPAFVEDIVRDVAVILRSDVRVARFRVRATNQESIHAHDAVAQVRWERGRS